MNHKAFTIAENMAKKLFAAENAIDAAITQAADLAGFMPIARQEVRVSADVGQEAIEALLESMKMLSEARRRMIDTHSALAKTQESARLAPRNFGGFVNKPGAHLAPGKLTVVPAKMEAVA